MFPKLISKATFKHFFVNSLQKHRQAKLFNLREKKTKISRKIVSAPKFK